MTNRNKYTTAERDEIDAAILKALDPNGATMKAAEIEAHVHDAISPELRSRWDFRLYVGGRLQALRLAGKAEFRKGPGSGWRHARG